MSLNYDISKTAFTASIGERDMTSEEGRLAEGMIFQTMGAGIGDLTEKTEDEFYARQVVWNKLHGYEPFTVEQVHSFVGMHTNVAYETEAQWMKRIVKYRLETSRSSYRVALKEAAEKAEQKAEDDAAREEAIAFGQWDPEKESWEDFQKAMSR